VEPNTSHVQDGSGPGRPASSAAPALSEASRYLASVLAATAIESGVDELGLRRLFTGCDEAASAWVPTSRPPSWPSTRR